MEKENNIKIRCYPIESINLDRYNNFVSKYGVVQQSSHWLKSQTNKHRKPLIIIVENTIEILGACGIIYSKIFFSFLTGRFFIPGSPTINGRINNKKEVIEAIFNKIDEEAKRRRIISIEWNTLWSQWKDKNILKKHNYQIKELRGWILDITKGEEEIYKKVSSSHKRCIHRADRRNDIRIYESNDIQSFYRLWNDTYKRAGKKLPLSALKYLDRVYNFLSMKRVARIFFVEKDNQLLCGNFMLYYGDVVYYLHGGSISGERYGASHLLNWNLIKDGIREGYKNYYFGGSWAEYPDKRSKEQAEGINEFKRRFGASAETFYCGDKVLSSFRRIIYQKMLILCSKLKI